jgi:predicted Rossmann fold nucleotide-binding protein DprA/Smf involved in DNA uptake
MTNDAKAVIALTTRLGSKQRPSLSAQKWHRFAGALRDSGHSPSDVFDSSLDLKDVPGLGREEVEAVELLLSDGASVMLEADELSRKGIWAITVVDDAYPPQLSDRLKSNAPPVIFGVGNQSLLTRGGVGIVGSRDVGEQAANVAKDMAAEAVQLGRPVVSGGARGIDQLAMNAAFMAGGQVVGVLADSLLSRIRKPDVLRALDEGDVCLITQQNPSSGFTPASAMTRNKLIYGLSELTVVVCSDLDSGGTWAGATEALKGNNGIVVVWRGLEEGPGNSELEKLGAIPIKATKDIQRIIDQPSPVHAEQLFLIEHGD